MFLLSFPLFSDDHLANQALFCKTMAFFMEGWGKRHGKTQKPPETERRAWKQRTMLMIRFMEPMRFQGFSPDERKTNVA
jgi:hypothetical protein